MVFANRDLVVIGGSAGAVGPLKEILAALPADLPAAVAVVLHIPAESTGIFVTVSSAVSALRVKHAEEGEEVRHGHVYLAPPNRHLLILEGRIRLGTGPRENLVRPAIDPLFRSAALSYGPRAIGVILSGMLNDGASGLAAIKRCGGMALVQTPQEAEAREMPLAALEAAPVDRSAHAADLAFSIRELVAQPPGPPQPPPADIALEVEIAAGGAVDRGAFARLSKPTALTCPDCGGVLSEMLGDKSVRFRCQVGHAYDGKTLMTRQEHEVDEAMRVALRIIEERAALVERMGRDASTTGRAGMAETYETRAAEYRSYADVLRTAVLRQIEKRAAFETEDGDEAERRGPMEPGAV
ncbi:chemotaxis protein CheB [Rhodobacter sp. SGA-6-6]|uniref:chemotaxis protein CheB n=1 Tax=Rhodobacter sp. SGA-6-6 TaxID=2710882 RepID=UPI0013EA6AA0|nr:chemotaxis protein CheB [Rhodobacter sp. SGA-6-6]NGM46394.1 chemotaxis protein CheB [Rhodobacter sp. SGA-6-6]